MNGVPLCICSNELTSFNQQNRFESERCKYNIYIYSVSVAAIIRNLTNEWNEFDN